MAGKRQPRVTCGDTREIRVIADIGGTLARFALIDAAGDALEIGIQGAQICVGRHDVGPEHLQVEDDERGIKRLYGLAELIRIRHGPHRLSDILGHVLV
jgi:hypothetical protein